MVFSVHPRSHDDESWGPKLKAESCNMTCGIDSSVEANRASSGIQPSTYAVFCLAALLCSPTCNFPRSGRRGASSACLLQNTSALGTAMDHLTSFMMQFKPPLTSAGAWGTETLIPRTFENREPPYRRCRDQHVPSPDCSAKQRSSEAVDQSAVWQYKSARE